MDFLASPTAVSWCLDKVSRLFSTRGTHHIFRLPFYRREARVTFSNLPSCKLVPAFGITLNIFSGVALSSIVLVFYVLIFSSVSADCLTEQKASVEAGYSTKKLTNPAPNFGLLFFTLGFFSFEVLLVVVADFTYIFAYIIWAFLYVLLFEALIFSNTKHTLFFWLPMTAALGYQNLIDLFCLRSCGRISFRLTAILHSEDVLSRGELSDHSGQA